MKSTNKISTTIIVILLFISTILSGLLLLTDDSPQKEPKKGATNNEQVEPPTASSSRADNKKIGHTPFSAKTTVTPIKLLLFVVSGSSFLIVIILLTNLYDILAKLFKKTINKMANRINASSPTTPINMTPQPADDSQHENGADVTPSPKIKDRFDHGDTPMPAPMPIPSPIIDKERIRVFTTHPNVIGVSYRGDSHIKSNTPCQDFHSFKKVNNIWSIAIVSDGAGSKANSDTGSKAVCMAFTYYLEQLLTTNKAYSDGSIPNEKTWDIEFRTLLNLFQKEMKIQFVKPDKNFDSFAATIIILVYSPKGYMAAHIGDGRASVKYSNEWHSIMTPHKGEEANQTIFSTTIEFSKNPGLKMSGIYVPETCVSEEAIEAFALMSDGVECGAYATYQKIDLPDGDFRVEDINTPRGNTLETVLSILDKLSEEERQIALVNFITSYKELTREPDDKTLLIGKVQ